MRLKLFTRRPSTALMAVLWFATVSFVQDLPTRAAITLPNPQTYPSIACTAEELARLRDAYRIPGATHEVVAKRVSQANAALKAEVVFPPEGGQHNQWYQCDQCQLTLETVDATHHRCPNCR